MISDQIKKAVAVLRQGGVVVYPTDTLYALGADATNPVAVGRLIKLKGRDVKKGISVMVGSVDEIKAIASVNDQQEPLLRSKLPGPYTFVLPAAQKTVAVRIPNHPFALELARAFGKPITASSSNLAGKPPLNSLESLKLLGADYLLWVGPLPKSQPSTVVDLTKEKPRILRYGAGSWP